VARSEGRMVHQYMTFSHLLVSNQKDILPSDVRMSRMKGVTEVEEHVSTDTGSSSFRVKGRSIVVSVQVVYLLYLY